MRNICTVLRPIYISVIAQLFFMTAWINHVDASHVMGADITYECISGDTYRIQLKVYRNCGGATLADKLPLAFSSQSCGAPMQIDSALRTQILDVSPLCASQQQLSNCINPNFPFPGVEEHTYELLITFPQQCTDWVVGWSLCCRDPSVTNSIIPSFSSTRIYIEAGINNTIQNCNTSPNFISKPVTYICDGQPVQFNSGATEPDGDSLVFELTDPLDGNYVSAPTNVPYVSGFNINYPVATSPVNQFQFNQSSGQFNFVPNGLQKGIVAVRVNEYRDGQLIGYTMRDMQWVVIPCLNQSPIIQPPSNISGGVFNNNTFSVCAGDALSFDLTGLDLDPGDSLFVSNNVNVAIPGAAVGPVGASINPLTYTFNWPTTLADTGTYFISFTYEDNGCPTTGRSSVGFNVIVSEGTILPPTDIFYCPSITTSINLQASTPNTGGSYTWSPTDSLSNPNIANPVLSLPPSGIADLVVVYSQPGTCDVIEPFHIEPEATVNLSPDTVRICSGDSAQLNASFSVSGPPVNNIDLQWNPPQGLSSTVSPTPSASPGVTTLYTVTITAPTLNCSYEADVLVIVEDAPQIDPIADALICAGDSVQLTATGNFLSGATLSWSPTLGLSDPTILNPMASPGSTTTYTLTATNQCGSDTESNQVTVNQPLNVVIAADDISCAGGNDGSVTASTIGGSTNPTYTWTPGLGAGPSFNNLTAGTYVVTAVDNAGCTDTDSVTLVEPSPLSLAINNVTNISCSGLDEGIIEVLAQGGTAPYEYSLNNASFVSSGNFITLFAGTYNITVRDANNCLFDSGPITLTEPANGVQANLLSSTDASCGLRGQMTVSGSGGLGPLAYSIDGGINFQPTGSFMNLDPGFYTVIVQDQNGCFATVSDTIREIDPPIAVIDSLKDVSCYGFSDGVVRITVNLGSPPYLLALDGVATPDTFFNNLSAGYHFFQVEDGQSCKYGLVFFIDEPDSLYGQVVNQTEPSCVGSTDGELSVSGVGGIGPYIYQINNGGLQDSIFAPLGAGTYNFTVIDANDCVANFPGTLNDPDPLEVQSTEIDIACAGEQNGSISLTATGGTPDYEFRFENSGFVDDTLFFGLGAGTYDIFVRDANGCIDSAEAIVVEPLPLNVSVTGTTLVSCNGGSDGTISLVANGGTEPYEFSTDLINFTSSLTVDSLAAGTYTVYARDLRGCLAEVTATVGEPDALFGTVDWRDISCFGADDGGGTVNMTGGTSPYFYEWSNGETGASVNNLPPGNPVVFVRDVNGCEVAFSGDLIEPDSLYIDSTQVIDASCFGFSDGFLYASPAGGNAPYTFIWSNGAVDSIQNNVAADDYIVTLIDSSGCDVQDTLTVNEPPEIVIDIIDQMDASCGLDNGEVTVRADGGAGGFDYIWSTGDTGPTATGLLGGPTAPFYQVFATDSTGCSNSLEVQLGVGEAPIADFETEFSPVDSILFPRDGVQFNNLSQFATDYLWLFGDGASSDEENPRHVFPEPGEYIVTLIAYDPAFQCPDTISKRIIFYPPGNIWVPTGFTPNNDQINDEFYAVGVGVLSMKIDIFDRWGRHLRTLNSLEETWDGKNQLGNPVQEGVYVWKLEAILNDQVRVDRVGTVTLVR
ncbi:MAG: gliding motility-associated C-terminal domain-containing protein [Bacteroidota bacterium]